MIIEGNELWLAKNLSTLSKFPNLNKLASNFYKISFQVVESKLRVFKLENFQDYPIFYLMPKVESKITVLDYNTEINFTSDYFLKNTAPENKNLVITNEFIYGPVINYNINYNYAHSYFPVLGIYPLKIIPFYKNDIALAIFKWYSDVLDPIMIDFINQKSIEFVNYEPNPEILKYFYASLINEQIFIYY